MDDPFDSNKKDLIDFIDNETLDITLTNSDISKIYKLYYKNLSKILFDIYQKLHTIQKINVEEVMVYGLNMVNYIFFFMLSYSNNIKLTMFFSERAVLLYTEFIIMSRNPILNNDFKFTPSINDALQFVYKKTIGSIKPKNIQVSRENASNYKLLKYIFRDINSILLCAEKYILFNKLNLDEHKELLELSVMYISSSLMNVYKLDSDLDKINDNLHNVISFIDKPPHYFINNLVLFKTYLDIFEDIYNMVHNLEQSEIILAKGIPLIFNEQNITDIDKNALKNKKKTSLFKTIKSHLIEYL